MHNPRHFHQGIQEKPHTGFLVHLFWFSIEPHCFPCADTFVSIVGHSCAVASQSLFCPGFVQVMFVAFGKVAPACEWMPLFWALKTWPGSEGVEATSSEEMVCVLAFVHNKNMFLILSMIYSHFVESISDCICDRFSCRADGGEPWRWSRGHWAL